MAERNFDEEFGYESQEGHSFTLGGHTFRTPPVAPPGAFLEGGRGLVAAVRFLRRVVMPEDRPELERILEMPDTSATLLDLAPSLLDAAANVIASADDEQSHASALAELAVLVDKAQAPSGASGPLVSAREIDEVAGWLMDVTLGTSPKEPSPSSNGAARTSPTSKAVSRKPVARSGKN